MPQSCNKSYLHKGCYIQFLLKHLEQYRLNIFEAEVCGAIKLYCIILPVSVPIVLSIPFISVMVG